MWGAGVANNVAWLFFGRWGVCYGREFGGAEEIFDFRAYENAVPHEFEVYVFGYVVVMGDADAEGGSDGVGEGWSLEE